MKYSTLRILADLNLSVFSQNNIPLLNTTTSFVFNNTDAAQAPSLIFSSNGYATNGATNYYFTPVDVSVVTTFSKSTLVNGRLYLSHDLGARPLGLVIIPEPKDIIRCDERCLILDFGDQPNDTSLFSEVRISCLGSKNDTFAIYTPTNSYNDLVRFVFKVTTTDIELDNKLSGVYVYLPEAYASTDEKYSRCLVREDMLDTIVLSDLTFTGPVNRAIPILYWDKTTGSQFGHLSFSNQILFTTDDTCTAPPSTIISMLFSGVGICQGLTATLNRKE